MSVIAKPNAWVAVDSDPKTQLTYAPRVDPAPLTVSVPGRDPTFGSLVVVVTNETPGDIAVASITFTIVVGQPGKDGSPLMPTTAKVKAQVSDTTTWSFNGPPNPVTSGTADYVLAPVTGGSATLAAGKSVYVEIYDFQTVVTPSTSTIVVDEALAGTDPAFTSFAVSTFPDGFFFDSLIPTVRSGSALIPVAQVPRDSPVTLTWNSSVVDTKSQKILYSDASGGQQSATPDVLGEWTTPHPLTSDTVFAVSVVAQGAGGEPLTAALVTSVSVQNPVLVASNITTGQATVSGEAKVGSLRSDGSVAAKELSASGDLTANGARLTGALGAGSATLQGQLGAASASVGGALGAGSANVTGHLQAGSIGASTATFTGGLTARQGPVSLIGSAATIGTGTFLARTDGLVLGTVGWPSSTNPGCVGYAAGSASGMTVRATGGNLGAFGPAWREFQASNSNTFVLPVASGTYYSLNAWQCGGSLQQDSAPIWFYWVPLGTAPSGMETTERVGEPSEDLVPPDPPTPSDVRGAERFVALLEPYLAKPLDEPAKKELEKALLDL